MILRAWYARHIRRWRLSPHARERILWRSLDEREVLALLAGARRCPAHVRRRFKDLVIVTEGREVLTVYPREDTRR